MPAVAREAGVSVPTVYRHFRTKADLFTALYPHMIYRARSVQLEMPSSIDDFGRGAAGALRQARLPGRS